ncbi:LemA family protein [Fructilactobacillus vespulae]|uniref:LemA family protein n=1 Tax=Fructilactobacillus vespulae TaxID=1249630 RepID=UPI0039B4321F
MTKKTRNISIIAGIVVFLIVAIGGWYIATQNKLNVASQDVDQQWSNVDVQLQRRADLTPQLVGAVKGNMKNEQKIFGDIATARKQYDSASTPSDKVKASDNLGKQTQVLINAVHENYPQLASSANVSTLMTQIEGSENRISQTRRDYNAEVQSYNKKVISFPSSIVANNLNLKTKPFFQADANAAKAPKVDLN